MNLGATDITVDGLAMTTAVKSQLTSSDATVDIIELKRKVERKDAELKRKDREIGNLQRDLQKALKEKKEIAEENETLNRSLANARMLNASVLDDSLQVELRHKISDLEGKLAESEAFVNDIKGELEAYRANNTGLEEGLVISSSNQEYTSHLHRTAMQDVQDLNVKVKILQAQISDKDMKIDEMAKEAEKLKDSERRYKGMTEHQRMLLGANDKTLADQSAEIKALKSAIQVRNETNNSLRDQVEELSDNNFVLSKSEMEHLRKMEKENESFQTRIRDLVKSVELHMDLLQRAEAESAALRLQAEENSSLLAEFKRRSEERVQLSETDNTTLKFLKKEVVKLRNENKDLTQKLETSSAELHALQSLRGGVISAGMTTTRGTDIAERKKPSASNEQEKMLRQAAEEATRALRNRMSFLLEQMEQASQLAASWQEQKAILKAEIGSLLRANHDLRERLVSVQRTFMGQSLHEAGIGTQRKIGTGPHAFITDSANDYQQHEAAERLAEGLIALDQLGDSLQGPYMQPVPNSPEAMVERRLFDAICAFTLGTRVEDDREDTASPSKSLGKTKRRPIKLKGIFKVSQTPDNRVDIYVEDGDVDAAEVLASLQIPAFLKFVQSRPIEKIPRLFTEKMANILNYSRRTVHDFLEQLGDARIHLGKLQSKVSVSWERVNRIRDRCSKERLSKQKSVMRYIREQLRISDLRKVLEEVGQRSVEHLDDLMHSERGGLLGMRDQGLKETMAQLVQVTRDLTALANGAADGAGDSYSLAASAAVGSIEIRLSDSQLDDETLHGVVGLICGVLAPGSQDLGGSDKSSGYDGYHRMVAGNTEDSEPVDRNGGGTNILLSSLGVKVSERQVAATNTLARSILATRCDYTDRIILLNLRGNSLTDLSCKVLAAMVEKSSTLRMLDLRENLVSTTGAKFLFDATRRNISVLYVTQRQNGYMIEGHREILGSGAPKKKERNGNSYDEPGLDIADGQNVDSYEETQRQSKYGESGKNILELPKHPLRIDMRNNNPSREAIEALLESIEYKSAVRYIPPEAGAVDPPISLKSIVNDTRTFEEAYSGKSMEAPEPFLIKDEHHSFTPAGLSRNHFSGMLSTVANQQVHPYGNGEKRPQSASISREAAERGPSNRPYSATRAAIGNKLYNSIKQNRTYEDEEDFQLPGVNNDISDMIINRKDRERGINGVGGLLEQQIRKLQLTQPLTSSAEPASSHDSFSNSNQNMSSSWEAHMNKKNLRAKKLAHAKGPSRQQQVVNAYTSSVPSNRPQVSHISTPEKARRNIGPQTHELNSGKVDGFVNVLRRAKSAGPLRPTSANATLRSSHNGKNPMEGASGAKKQKNNASRGSSNGYFKSSGLPLVNNGGGEANDGHHNMLQNKINGFGLNPTLLF